jgi:hypothetical protein
VADDKPPRTASPDDLEARHARTTAVGAVDSFGTQPMTSLPAQGAGPPPMPTGVGAPSIGGPPAMPPATPPAMPPAMPGAAPRADAGTSSSSIPLPPSAVMPTIAGDPLPHHQPPSLPPARYQLGNEIARGGMGRVVDATDTVLGRVVAFKEVLSIDNDTLRRFQREVRITARLEHPSIVPVHDAGTSGGGAPFYVMRKVSGRPLERLVASAETLNQRLALIPHIVNSAQAIAHAHERGIVHRDIKPSNILVGELGETVVIDWGLAKVIGEPDEQTTRPLVDLADTLKTRAGIVYGTPGFMAPEQLRGAPVDERCDVYALGATLYHLLSRKPPHYAKTADEMMKAAVAAPPTPIHELVDGVPPDLETIVGKALAHDPQVRYQNARALAEDLQRFLTGQLVASHHYTPLEKLVRFVRKNRGVSAAVAALILVGTIAVIRIVVERNRADQAARDARHQAEQALRHSERLTLSQARYDVDQNPTRAVAMLKPLATKYWREVRAIAAAARAAGVAWGIPVSPHTLSLEMSRDGLRALTAGDDGVLRIHDLAARTTRTILALGVPAMARFADGERRIVAWHDARIVIVDAAGGARRDLATTQPILDLEVVGTTAYWVDQQHALWQLDLAGDQAATPSAIPLDEGVHSIAPSPDGRWIALACERHVLVHDRTRPTEPPAQAGFGLARHIVWASTSTNFAALVGDLVIDVAVDGPIPTVVTRQTIGNRQFVAHSGGRVYTVGPTGVSMTSRDGSVSRRQVSGTPVGLVESRGGTVIAGGTSGLVVLSDDGDRALPMQATRIEGVHASPRSPYVIADLQGRLLLWNLDEIQPRRLTRPGGGALFASADRVIVGGALHLPALSINIASGEEQPLGDWQGLRAAAATPDGRVVALVDDARRLHLVRPGRAPEDLDGEIEIAGFATSDQRVRATLDGAVDTYDVGRSARKRLIPPRSQLIGLAWGRGHHPWIAAAFLDSRLWRKNLVTGAEATIARVPRVDATNPAERDSKLLVDRDGTVLFLHGTEVHAWRPDGTLALLARTPKPLADFGEAGARHVVAFTGDNTIYVIPRDGSGRVVDALPSIDGTSASMSPETGLLVVLDHGAIGVIDPLVRQQWTLASVSGITFANPLISSDGRSVLAQTERSLLLWSIDLPADVDATRSWLDAMTNAVVNHDHSSGLGWR